VGNGWLLLSMHWIISPSDRPRIAGRGGLHVFYSVRGFSREAGVCGGRGYPARSGRRGRVLSLLKKRALQRDLRIGCSEECRFLIYFHVRYSTTG
jgi:hypothetical protein